MSVRAYEITTFEFAEAPTFNLWHDEELMELLEPYLPEDFNSSAGGYLEFSLEQLEEARKEAKAKETQDTLDEMVQAAKKSKDGWVQFWCF